MTDFLDKFSGVLSSDDQKAHTTLMIENNFGGLVEVVVLSLHYVMALNNFVCHLPNIEIKHAFEVQN